MIEGGGRTTRHALADPVFGGLALATALGIMAVTYGGFLAYDAYVKRRDRRNPGAGE